MIKKLILNNFKSHETLDLKLETGTNLIIGQMGSGKSTILEAICFALFGKTPKTEKKKINVADLISFEKQSASVIIEIFDEKTNDLIYIKREIFRKKSTKAELRINSKLYDVKKKAIELFLKQRFGITYDLFTRAIYSSQNETDQLFHVDPKVRKNEFDKLLGIANFQQAEKNLTRIINLLKQDIENYNISDLNKKIEEIEKEIEKIEKQRNKTNEEINFINEQIKKQIKQIEEVKDIYLRLKEKKQRFDELKSKIRVLEGKRQYLEEIVKEFVEYKGIEEKERLLEEKKAEKKVKKKSIEEINGELTKIEVKLSKIDLQIKDQEEAEKQIKQSKKQMQEIDVKKIEEQIQNIQTKINVNNSTIIEFKRKKPEYEKIITNLHEGDVKCPVCGTLLGPKKINEILNEKKQELERIKKEMEKIEIENRENEKHIKELKMQQKKYEFYKQKIENLKTRSNIDLEKLELERHTLIKQKSVFSESKTLTETEISNIELEIKELEKQINEQKKYIENKKKLDSIISELKEKEIEIKTIDFNDQKYIKYASEFSAQTEKMNSLKKQKIMLMERADILAKTFRNLEVQKKERLYEIEKRRAYISGVEQLLIFRNSLKSSAVKVRKNLLFEINSLLNDIWQAIYPYTDYDEIRIETDEKTYFFEARKNDKWLSAEYLSGGERICFSIAIRVVLSILLSKKLSLLMLDEPTHNLDKQAIDLVVQTLNEKLPNMIEQIIVVSHEEKFLESEGSNIVQLFKDKNAGDEI